MSRHEYLHRLFLLANLGHNPGCSSADCPLRESDPTAWERIAALFRRKSAEQPEGRDR